MVEKRVMTSGHIREMYTGLGLGDALRREGVAAHAEGEQPTLTESSVDRAVSLGVGTKPPRDREIETLLKGAEVLKILQAVHDRQKRR